MVTGITAYNKVRFMNKLFYEMIFKRKSFHFFRNVGKESIGEYVLNAKYSLD